MAIKFKVGKLVRVTKDVTLAVTRTANESYDKSYDFKANTVCEIIGYDTWVDVWFPVERVFAYGCGKKTFKGINE